MDTKYGRVLNPSEPRNSVSVVDQEEAYALLLETPPKRARTQSSMSFIVIISALNILLFFLSSFFFMVWFYHNHMAMNAQYKKTSSYTPILDRIPLKSEVKRLNGTFWPPLDPSIARQMSDEADNQWAEFDNQRVIPVTSAQIRAMGIDPSTVAKLENRDWGLGDDAYVAALDVYHQLHCLNTLRQIAYPERYPDSSRHRGSPVRDFHIDHCIDILMQDLQCSGNLNLNTWHWVENHDWPFPIFSINRKCVDFEAVTQWRLENAIDMDKYFRVMQKPLGAKELRAADDFYKYEQPDMVNPNHRNGTNPNVHFIL